MSATTVSTFLLLFGWAISLAPNDITVSFEQSIFASSFLNKLCKRFTTIRGSVESEKCCSLHCRKAGDIQNTGNIIRISRKDLLGYYGYTCRKSALSQITHASCKLACVWFGFLVLKDLKISS